jgi:hypothetical protein
MVELGKQVLGGAGGRGGRGAGGGGPVAAAGARGRGGNRAARPGGSAPEVRKRPQQSGCPRTSSRSVSASSLLFSRGAGPPSAPISCRSASMSVSTTWGEGAQREGQWRRAREGAREGAKLVGVVDRQTGHPLPPFPPPHTPHPTPAHLEAVVRRALPREFEGLVNRQLRRVLVVLGDVRDGAGHHHLGRRVAVVGDGARHLGQAGGRAVLRLGSNRGVPGETPGRDEGGRAEQQERPEPRCCHDCAPYEPSARPAPGPRTP